MNNKYNELEKQLAKRDLSETEKIKILEKQKDLLLQFLIDSNKSLFKSIILRRKESPPTEFVLQETL